MNKVFLFVFAIALSSPALAGLVDTPVLRSTDIDERHLHAFTDIEGRPTLADFYEANRPSKASQEQLTKLTNRGQTLWLNGSIEGARAVFKELSQLALSDDWREAQRESIHYAELRLAQSALTPVEVNQWLEKAILDFPDLQPSTKIFPPPLVASFNDAKAHLRSRFSEVDLGERFSNYKYLLVNGRKFDIEDSAKISMPPGPFRVTLLSNSHPRVTETMTASQLRIFQVVTPPIASGTCADPHLADGPELDFPVSVLYKDDCYRTHNRSGWLNASPDLSELQMKGVEIPSTTSRLNPANSLNGFDVKPPEEKFFTKRSMFIIGASVVVAGIAYAVVNHQRHTETEATHVQGY